MDWLPLPDAVEVDAAWSTPETGVCSATAGEGLDRVVCPLRPDHGIPHIGSWIGGKTVAWRG